MKPAPFEYQSANNADHAISLLIEGGEDARVLAGGQSLVAMMNFRIARPTVLVDLARCADLAYVRVEDNTLCIGAMTRQRTAQDDPLVVQHAPLVSHVLSKAGPATIRNRGTVGGSIANGYPVAHLPATAVCLSAEIVLQCADGKRVVPAKDFFLDAMATDIAPMEIVVECRFPVMPATDRFYFREVANHSGGGAICLLVMRAKYDATGSLDSINAVVSGFAGVPLKLARLEALAISKSAAQSALEEAFDADLQDVIPADDMDAQGKYVADVCRSMAIEGAAQLHRGVSS